MCAAVDGRQTIPDRWLSLLVSKIRTGSWGGIKTREAVNPMKTRPTFQCLFIILTSEM